MKRVAMKLIFAATFALSAITRADSLPPGAVRFNKAASGFALQPIDITKGRVLVITDVVTINTSCTLLDGNDEKIFAPPSGNIAFQTGIEFGSQLRTQSSCWNITISGYWADAR